MRGIPEAQEERPPQSLYQPRIQRRVGEQPTPTAPAASVAMTLPNRTATPYSTFSSSNDGVFANLNAKPELGEKTEEQPPVSFYKPDSQRVVAN